MKNLGNMTASGTLDLSLYASTDGTIDPASELLATIVAHPIRVRAGKSTTSGVRFVAPANLAPGSYRLIAAAMPMTSPPGINAANNQTSAVTRWG